jgi:hypothetical protein
MTLTKTLTAVGLLCLVLPTAVLAQAELERNVVAGGGGTASSAGHAMTFTVGQYAVGPVGDGTYDLAIGFWHRLADGTPVLGDLPAVFGLDQNYPNPFNPMTVIRFALPEAQPVRLAIYNVRGQRIRLLVDEERPAGRHEVVWDGADDHGRGVASGTYFARIESSAGVLTRKMLLAR